MMGRKEKRKHTKITERIPASRGDLFERSTEMVFISILGWGWFPDGQARGFAFFSLLFFYLCLFASAFNLGFSYSPVYLLRSLSAITVHDCLIAWILIWTALCFSVLCFIVLYGLFPPPI
jgi:hypothetical protein